MKKFRNIILIILGVILLLNILVVVLLNIPAIQQKVLNIVVTKLEQKLDTEISIGRIHLNLFHGVTLDDIYIADQRGDTLLYAGALTANTSILRVYSNHTLRIDHVSLENFKVYLARDTPGSPFNYQFIIDAFVSQDTTDKDTTPSEFDLRINNIELIDGRFGYDIRSKPETPGKFNASHIRADNLNGRLSLGSIQLDRLTANIYQLAAVEKSGLDLRNLKGNVVNRDKTIRLLGFEVELPRSRLTLSDVWLDYGNVSSADTLFMTHAVYNIQIEPSVIVPADLRTFLPDLAEFTQQLHLEGALHQTAPAVGLQNLKVTYGSDLDLNLSASMANWNDYRHSTYDVNLSRLYITQNGIAIISRMASPQTQLPDIVRRLGPVNLTLRASGLLSDIRMNASVKSNPGTISINGNGAYRPDVNGISANAYLTSEAFDLNAILDTSLHLGTLALNLHATASMADGREPEIRANGELPYVTYQDYVYRHLKLEGAYLGKRGMEAEVSLQDSNVNLQLEARMNQLSNNVQEYTAQGSIRHFNPYNLNLTTGYRNSWIGTDIDLHIRGNVPDDMVGYVRLDSLDFIMDTVALKIDSVLLTLDKKENNESLIQLTSPYITAKLEGFFNPSTIVATAKNILHPYLPTFIPEQVMPQAATPNNFTLEATIGNTRDLTRAFHLPVTVLEQSSITAALRGDSGEIVLKADFPDLIYGTISIKETGIFVGELNNMYVADVHTFLHMEKQNPIDITLHAELEQDVVLLNLKYDNNPADFSLKGELRTLVTFKQEQDQDLLIQANFLPSDLTVNELTVEFEPAIIAMQSGKIRIQDFGLVENDRLFLGVNGTISNSNADTLKVSFENASIANLLGGLNRTDLQLDGYLDGDVYLSGILGHLRFYTDAFKVNNIVYGSEQLGSLTLNSDWDDAQRGMNIGILLFREGEDVSAANGFISPERDLIQFDVNLQMFPINVAQPFLEGVVHNLAGYCGADLRATGKLSAPDVVGYVYLKDAVATVDYTDVTYRLSDTIQFTPTTITIEDLIIYDNNDRTARINCSVRHQGFTDINYTASLRMTDFLLVNNPSMTDSLFYGRFAANGNLNVRGTLDNVSVTGNLSNSDRTNLMVRLPESATQARTYSTIVYVEHDTLPGLPGRRIPDDAFSIKANVAVQLTDGATLGVIINSGTGDEVVVKGSGNINANYDSDMGGIKLFGQYEIVEGHLKIKLSQLPTKLFNIQPGSKITMNGDPMASSFDITANYRLRADLATLDPSFANIGLSSTRVPVECILHVSGNLSRLDLTYDITLPDSNDEMNRMVSSIINTDDLRIKEFAYLIAFGSFFPPSGAPSTGGNLFTSLASSSISTVLNNVLGGVLGNKWTIGTDVNASEEDFSDLEMNVSLSTQLFNDRLILNTNLGYRSGAATVDQSPWIGDFDVEYKLTKSGMWRVKAYNHTNNEIFRTSNTTQGVGIVYTREAKKFKDLFRFKKKKKAEETPSETEIPEE